MQSLEFRGAQVQTEQPTFDRHHPMETMGSFSTAIWGRLSKQGLLDNGRPITGSSILLVDLELTEEATQAEPLTYEPAN